MSPDVTPHFFIEMLGAAISVLILTGYHVWLWWRVQREPAYTVQAIHAMARSAWVQSIMESGRDILAIQTLRNSTMAATLMASTAVLLIVGVLTLSGQGDKLQITWSTLKSFNGTDPSLWEVKLLALIVDLTVAFFSFALAIRKFHHVGYLLNVPPPLRRAFHTPTYVDAYMNGAGRSFSLGMRTYYFLLPLVFWLFGPALMVTAALALVAILHHLDRGANELELLPTADLCPGSGEREGVGRDLEHRPAEGFKADRGRLAGRATRRDPGGVVAAKGPGSIGLHLADRRLPVP